MSRNVWQHAQGALRTIASNGRLGAVPDSASLDVAPTIAQVSSTIVIAAGTTLTVGGSHQIGPYGTEEVDGPGTLHTTGIVTLDEGVYLGGGLTWVNSGTIDENNTLYGGDAAGATATLTNASGASFSFTGDNENIDNNGNGRLTVVNDGTITKTGGTGGSTIDVTLNNAAGGVISSDSGTLYLQGGGSFAGSIGGTGTVDFDGGVSTVATTLTANSAFNQTGGTIIVEAGATLALAGAQFGPNGTGTINGPGTLHTTGVTTQDESVYLGGGLTWVNSGTIDENNTLYGGDAAGATATLTNASGASFTFTGDNENIDNNGNGRLTVVNDGTITKTGGTGGSTIDVTLNNAAGGVISSDSGTLYLQGGGSFAGSIGGTGTVDFDGGISTIATTLTANRAFNQTGGTIIVESAATLGLAGAQLGPNGTGDIDGPGTLHTTGVTTQDESVYLGGGLTWVNSGTIDENNTLYGGDAAGATATLTNASGASFAFTGDNENIDNNGNGRLTVVNDGTITKTGGTGGSTIDVTLNNAAGGVISSDSGTLYLQGGGSFAGSIGGTGTVDFDGGVSTVATTLTANRAFNQTGGTIIVESAATLGLAGAQLGPNGTGDIDGPGTLHTTGVTTQDESVYLGGGLTWVNSGTIDENNTLYGGDAAGATATLTNASGASFAFTGDNENIDNNGNGRLTVVNDGTITKTGGTGGSTIDVTLNNTAGGMISSDSGTLYLQGGGSFAGSIGGTGTVDFDGGISTIATTLTANRAFNQTGGTIIVESAATLGLAGAQLGPNGTGDIDGPGTLHTTGVTTQDESVYLGGGLTWVNSGTIDENNTLYGGDAAGATATLTNASGASFAFTGDNENIDNNGGVSGYLTVVNDGTIAKTGGTGGSTIDVALQNAGRVGSESGTLVLAGPITNTGSIEAAAGSSVDIAGALVGSGTLVVDGGGTIEVGVATAESARFTGAGLLRLDLPANFTGTIGGLTPGAQIALGGSEVTGFTLNGSRLTITVSGGTSYTLSVSGLNSSDSLTLANNVLTVGSKNGGSRPDMISAGTGNSTLRGGSDAALSSQVSRIQGVLPADLHDIVTAGSAHSPYDRGAGAGVFSDPSASIVPAVHGPMILGLSDGSQIILSDITHVGGVGIH